MTADVSPVLSVHGLCKSFGQQAVLRDVHLQVERGQLIGLVGKNGAGKSTMLRILVGIGRRNSGQVSVLGRDPANDPLGIRQHCCYLPGETSVYHGMTGQQFLDFALSFYPRVQKDLLGELRDLFDLPLHKKVRGYSAGMKQKLALMATLTPDVELYLLDEPDRALDASVRFQLRDLLGRLRDAGRTLVLSSHHLAEVETLANRLEFLLDGTMVDEDSIRRARARLQKRFRLRLRQPTELPAGLVVLETEPDGTLVLEADGDPMQSLSALPADSVLSIELGIARLEELYQLLLAQTNAPREPKP